MICPKCKKESNGTKWCPWCGIQLETDVMESVNSIPSRNDYKVSEYEEKPMHNYENTGNNHNNTKSGTMKSGTKIFLAILIPVIAVAIIFAGLVFGGIIDLKKAEETGSKDSIVLEDEDTKKLLKTGMNHLKIGDYEEAETVFKVLMETEPENEEYVIICQIIHNYNRSEKRIQSKDYEGARSYFEKIPLDYMDYDIKDDVDKLESEIKRFETAYEIFSKVKEYMSSSDYENAKKTMNLIDRSCMKPADLEILDDYEYEIEEFSGDSSEDLSKYDLSLQKAGEIIRNYCLKYVEAVNSGDFSIVSSVLKGNLYNTQRGMVSSLYSQGIKEQFDFLTVISVQKINDTKWNVKVSEGETVFYPDGEESSKTYSWVYTVEYADGAYYLTDIK